MNSTLGRVSISVQLDRKPCPSDVSDEEWDFVIPYLMLPPKDTPQHTLTGISLSP
jgi:hypothetical protein